MAQKIVLNAVFSLRSLALTCQFATAKSEYAIAVPIKWMKQVCRGCTKLFVGRKSLLVHEILSLIRASQQINTTVTLRVKILKYKFNQSLGLPFKELLPSSAIGQALKKLKIKYKKRLFDPLVTLWAFLSQVLDTDKSCHNAVSKIIAYLRGEGVEIPSLRDALRTTDTSAYCQARSRLPEKLLENLFSQAVQNLEEKVTTKNLWCGRNIKPNNG